MKQTGQLSLTASVADINTATTAMAKVKRMVREDVILFFVEESRKNALSLRAAYFSFLYGKVESTWISFGLIYL